MFRERSPTSWSDLRADRLQHTCIRRNTGTALRDEESRPDEERVVGLRRHDPVLAAIKDPDLGYLPDRVLALSRHSGGESVRTGDGATGAADRRRGGLTLEGKNEWKVLDCRGNLGRGPAEAVRD